VGECGEGAAFNPRDLDEADDVPHKASGYPPHIPPTYHQIIHKSRPKLRETDHVGAPSARYAARLEELQSPPTFCC
jgi:hypothetical protein